MLLKMFTLPLQNLLLITSVVPLFIWPLSPKATPLIGPNFSKVLLKYPLKESGHLPYIRPLFQCRRGGFIRVRVGDGVYRYVQQYFRCIVVISFADGEIWRKPLTCHKSLTNFITFSYIKYTSP